MILNLLGYYLVWWSIVVFEKASLLQYSVIIFLINLIIHFKFSVNQVKKEIYTIGLVFILGMSLDLLLSYFHVFDLIGAYWIWLPMIWITFGTTINYSFHKVLDLSKVMVFILGNIFGPLSYISAGKFGLLVYTNSIVLLVIHGFLWGLLMLVLKNIKRIKK